MATIQRQDKLTEDVHVKVSRRGKAWLARKSGNCNIPRGRIIDDLVKAEILRERDGGPGEDEEED